MSQVRRSSPGRVDRSLRELVRARDRLQRTRRDGGPRGEEQRLRTELMGALQEYADAVAASGQPLPYRVRDELALYRGLGDRS